MASFKSLSPSNNVYKVVKCVQTTQRTVKGEMASAICARGYLKDSRCVCHVQQCFAKLLGIVRIQLMRSTVAENAGFRLCSVDLVFFSVKRTRAYRVYNFTHQVW